MTEPTKIIGNHIIYGSWDSTGGDEFLVFYHPNGLDATVFILDGADYGGGINFYFDCKSDELDKIINSSNLDWEIYKKVSDFGKEKK